MNWVFGSLVESGLPPFSPERAGNQEVAQLTTIDAFTHLELSVMIGGGESGPAQLHGFFSMPKGAQRDLGAGRRLRNRAVGQAEGWTRS